MSFASLKKNRASSLDNLSEQSKKSRYNNDDDDSRFWKLSVDKAENGFAIIRFMPEPDGEAMPWITEHKYSIKGPKGWYIEPSLMNIGKDDPVLDYNKKLKAERGDEGKELAKKSSSKRNFISNIVVMKDPANPENEGKIFLFRYGAQIKKKIDEATDKDRVDPDPSVVIKAFNPFDLWDGANFRIKAKKVDGFRNYTDSAFDSQTAFLDGDDEKLEIYYNKLHSLEKFFNPANYKTYEALQKRFYSIMGLGDAPVSSGQSEAPRESAPAPEPAKTAPEPSQPQAEASPPSREEPPTPTHPGDNGETEQPVNATKGNDDGEFSDLDWVKNMNTDNVGGKTD